MGRYRMGKSDNPVGVFDSGIGGLTVVKELLRVLPQERFIYFGDTARVPYGNKSKETIIRFTLENILFLLKQDVKLVVIACNTSSSIALPLIKQYFRIPILGVVIPAVKESVYATRNKRIGIIGTRATIESGTYEREIHRLDPEIKVFAKSCPLFVPLIEEGWLEGNVVEKVVRDYLAPLKEKEIDTLILACTHYPLLKKMIKKFMGKEILLIDSAREVAIEAKELLNQESLLYAGKRRASALACYVTDKSDIFQEIGSRFLGRRLENIHEIKD
ncbi:MAG: glutamate racemase [Candidatus Omnitrophica bacterium]|nr:glutamate racemase [Candidatus Omnitrophota bacterium]